MKIYIMNGAPGAGKSYFEKYICKRVGLYGIYISTVDFVKQVAYFCGWDGTKTLENREFLSDLKDILTKWNDIPTKKILDRIKNFENTLKVYKLSVNKGVVFIDCREPHEIEKLKTLLNAKTVCIRRKDAENNPTSNHADSDVLNYIYDIEIDNNNSLEEYNNIIEEFMKQEEINYGYEPQ